VAGEQAGKFDRHVRFDSVQDAAGIVQRRRIGRPDCSMFDEQPDSLCVLETV
jgi:hypothetical protein